MGGCRTSGGQKRTREGTLPKNFGTPSKQLLVCSALTVYFCSNDTRAVEKVPVKEGPKPLVGGMSSVRFSFPSLLNPPWCPLRQFCAPLWKVFLFPCKRMRRQEQFEIIVSSPCFVCVWGRSNLCMSSILAVENVWITQSTPEQNFCEARCARELHFHSMPHPVICCEVAKELCNGTFCNVFTALGGGLLGLFMMDD